MSGGKDSLTLAHSLKSLNYQLECVIIDLGIPEISEKSIDKAKKFCDQFKIKLSIISTLKEENTTIPEIAKMYKDNACAACGSIKRKILNNFANQNHFSVLATGHHLEDEVVSLFANNLRWDFSSFKKNFPVLAPKLNFVKKIKPLAFCREDNIRLYAQEAGLDAMGDVCPYSTTGTRTKYRETFKLIETQFPHFIEEYYKNFLNQKEWIEQYQESNLNLTPCEECGGLTVSRLCRVCLIKKRQWQR